jgi:hypothetical protein
MNRFHPLILAATMLSCPAMSVLAAEPPPSVVIGTIDPATGRAHLDERLLRRDFADGGVIKHFLAMPFHDGYNLLRIGHDADGNCRTEALRLARSDFKLKVQDVRWFTTCSSSTCGANNDDGDADTIDFAMCSPNHAKTACDCVGEQGVSNCNFGVDVGGMGLQTLLVQAP